jgi:hypothetical protein
LPRKGKGELELMAQNYDQVEGFAKYWDENEWRKEFFEAKLKPFYNAYMDVRAVLDFFSTNIQGMPLGEALRNDFLKPILLGGLKPDGAFSDDSLARFCGELFGVSIDDWKGYIHTLKEGISFNEAAGARKCIIRETDFAKVLIELGILLDRILTRAQQVGLTGAYEVPVVGIEEVKADPTIIADRVRSLLEKGMALLVNYNPYTFFIFSLWVITRRYMKAAYPRTSDEAVLKKMKELFGLSELHIPRGVPPEIAKEYTIYGFEKGTLGFDIIDLNRRLWDLIDLPCVQYYFKLESERMKYMKKAGRELKFRFGKTLEFPSGSCDFYTSYVSERCAEFTIPRLGPHLYEWSELLGISLGRDQKYSFLTFLDEISPWLFLHFAAIEPYGYGRTLADPRGIKCLIIPLEAIE